jgi:predicted O-linked N-acetylglucosamine transferase (SPINDLY family)
MSPQKLQALLQQAVAHHRAGELEPAGKLYRQVRAAAPKAVDAWHLGGLAAYQQGRSAEAVELLSRAHQLDRKSVVCEARLALALIAAGRAPEAEAHLRAVVARSPEFAEGWDNLAFCLKAQDRLADAVECHRRCVAAKPDFANGWYNYGLTLAVLGHPERALECHDKALALDPAFVAARFGRAQALHLSDRMVEAVEEYTRVLAANPALAEVRSCRLFAIHHVEGFTREQLFAEHVAYGRAIETRPVPVPRPADPDPARRLRLAILSPDLREHSCAYFLEPLLRHLDPAQFEVYLYHDHFRTDAVSARLQALAAVWRNFVGRPAAEVEQAIRADAPDILMDLAGHTGISNRLPLFARRLAPVQITYLGYPNTTGLAAMDYRFTDAIADPPGEAEAFATEMLVRFAPVAWCYSPPPAAPEVAPARTGPVTFGCFNSPNKVTDATLRLWARVLAAVPESRLLFKGAALEDPARQARYRARFAACGLPVDRIEFLGRTAGTAEHLACYGRLDVALDTFPYHGTTTTCEALWMGVPVVSLAGDRHVSRVGASLVTAAGHPEWSATTADDYVRIAAELAGDRVRLAALRAGLREDLRRGALLDHPAQAARFADALRECWRRRCAADGAAAGAAGPVSANT